MASQMLTTATAGGDIVYFSMYLHSERDGSPELRTCPFISSARVRRPRVKVSATQGQPRLWRQERCHSYPASRAKAAELRAQGLLPLLPLPSARPSAGGARPRGPLVRAQQPLWRRREGGRGAAVAIGVPAEQSTM